MPSFDSLAKIYQPLERIVFQGRLQAAREYCLPCLQKTRSGLIIGDGDGRFSARLLSENPSIVVDSIDTSHAMLSAAQQRAGGHAHRLRPRLADASKIWYPANHYDFIGLHFCLDCFSQPEVEALIPKLEGSLKPGGIIAYADFREEKPWHRFTVRLLYRCFQIGAGLQASKLPKVTWSERIQTTSEARYMKGLVFSQMLQKE